MSHPYSSLKRGQIYCADLNPVVGSEQGGTRPVLVLQNDIGNRYSPTTIVAAITSQLNKTMLPTHVPLNGRSCGLDKNSVVLLEQVRTMDRSRLKEYKGYLPQSVMITVDKAMSISFGLNSVPLAAHQYQYQGMVL
ncbi:type II toxin-antitoxin system PemK/MazF family toxin [Caproiciproducens sp. CPB-2]|uniref:type II toxin-antitoxin system PemK/MazF family toxin n=1 Tax=Caproiciproducens sp. CPB-2 TaxID=3030017 RepID=UPI0023DCA4FC|nr:type II toxin-antitoxin system PemK/MazF family toxin [Caproiciproducens sp. CPB-2]MDF1493789.1 type II toxin-antitoxin system PemK/MazF family toxin [Caproiciproducens sp. CPB-2]